MKQQKIFAVAISTITVFLLFITINLPQQGKIVLVGGGRIPTDAIAWFKKQAKSGKYLVITCQPEKSTKWFDLIGQVELIYPELLPKISLQNVAAIVIDGGDQWEYITRLDGKILKKAHDRGIPILGTSAGAMILGGHFFTAEQGTIDSLQALQNEGVCLGCNFTNIKLFENCIIDTHFKEREREGRLKVFIKKSGAKFGIGIDERTALCFDGKKIIVMGEGGVTIIRNDSINL
jgi:hypothetical protein